MKRLTKIAALGVAVPAMLLSAQVAHAEPTASGAAVVVQQDGITTHHVCASKDVVLVASGFAPNRHSVHATIQIVGSGPLFDSTIALSAGSGSFDTGNPGPSFVGAKFRVRFQTGSSAHPVNRGSFSGTIFDC
jgi:hypothetical protein